MVLLSFLIPLIHTECLASCITILPVCPERHAETREAGLRRVDGFVTEGVFGDEADRAFFMKAGSQARLAFSLPSSAHFLMSFDQKSVSSSVSQTYFWCKRSSNGANANSPLKNGAFKCSAIFRGEAPRA